MNSDFRQRILLPIVLPFGALLAILAVAYSLSRVLLAVEANLAVFIALGVAVYVLALAFLIDRRPRISSRALAVGTALGLLAVVGSGVVAAAAGPRPIEEEEDVAATGAEEGGEGAPEVPEGAVVFAAGQELTYTEAPETIPAGEATIALVLEGLEHNVVFEELGDQLIVEGDTEGVYSDTVTLEPGEITYYCNIAGHREAGMEGTLTVE